jgi:hypothetical protein
VGVGGEGATGGFVVGIFVVVDHFGCVLGGEALVEV